MCQTRRTVLALRYARPQLVGGCRRVAIVRSKIQGQGIDVEAVVHNLEAPRGGLSEMRRLLTLSTSFWCVLLLIPGSSWAVVRPAKADTPSLLGDRVLEPRSA